MKQVMDRIAGLEEWLGEQKPDVWQERMHLQEGSRERVYWHAGYLSALKDVMTFIGAGETKQ